MRLTVIGCSGSYPGPDSPASCYLLEQEAGDRTWRILLDLGSGALGYLHRYVDPLAVDAVFLSHLHPDHCFDMSGFYVMRKYHPSGAQPPIPVYGPQGTSQRLATAYGLPQQPGMTDEFDFLVYDGQPVDLGPFRVVTTKVEHPVVAYALRVSGGDGTLVYSGDTGPCRALTALAKGADLLLAEASFVEGEDNPPNLHLTGRDAAETATAADVGRLVLTHIPPWYDPQRVHDDARPSYDGPLDVARTGATYEL
jgi:ribonuclease BN (tRNA processing enzyme)